jgi:hypothetical protein
MPISIANKKIQPSVRAPSCMTFTIHQFVRRGKPVVSPHKAAIFMSPPEKSQTNKRTIRTKLMKAGSRQKCLDFELDCVDGLANMI